MTALANPCSEIMIHDGRIVTDGKIVASSIDFGQLLAEPPKWEIMEAIELIRRILPIAGKHNFYPALTGGLLYKEQIPRKDLDIVFYSNRQTKRPNRTAMLKELAKELDLKLTLKFNWLQKAKTEDGKVIDFFFPESKKLFDKEEEYIT